MYKTFIRIKNYKLYNVDSHIKSMAFVVDILTAYIQTIFKNRIECASDIYVFPLYYLLLLYHHED